MGSEAVEIAAAYLTDLTGKDSESISGLSRTDDGWQVRIEVVELERIPQTCDLLGSYLVDLTADGDLNGYERVRRYSRGQALDD
jgi:hypothetical protein